MTKPRFPHTTAVSPGGQAGAPVADSRCFERKLDALPDVVGFTGEVFDRRGIDRALLPAVDFAIEELFTNMVKYGAGSTAPIVIAIVAIAGGAEVTLTDRDSPPFDVTQAPDADVTLPIEQRVPGGLGLHLTRRLVDAIEYVYIPERRESRITFRKTDPGRATAATVKG
jgi:serine/threonine-protein kinase RsbW